MELFEYLKHIYRYKHWLIIGLIIGGLVGLTIAKQTPTQNQATLTLFVTRSLSPNPNQEFDYDGYYAQQTAINHTETVLELLSNQEIIKQSQATDATVNTSRLSPQLIQVNLIQESSDQASKTIQNLTQSLIKHHTQLSQLGDNRLSVHTVEANPTIKTIAAPTTTYILIGSFLGVILSLISSSIWSYITHHRLRSP